MADWFTQNAPPAPQGGDWFAQNAPPPAPPPQPSPVAKAGSAFWEGIGGPQWAPIVKALGNPSLSNPDAPDALAAVWNMAKGLAAEPGRVWNELGNTGAAMLKGDPLGAAYHLAGSVPLFGAPAQQVAQDLQRGDPAAAVGHTGAIIAPLVAGPAAELAGPAIAATGRGLETAAKVARGAAGGAFDAATEMVPFRKFGIPVSVPKPLVTGPAGAAAAAALGLPRELGGVVGAASPIVAGAVRGARAALAERAAQAAAAAEEAPIGPPRSPRALHCRRPQSSRPRRQMPVSCAAFPPSMRNRSRCRYRGNCHLEPRLAKDAGRRRYQLRSRDSGRIPAR